MKTIYIVIITLVIISLLAVTGIFLLNRYNFLSQTNPPTTEQTATTSEPEQPVATTTNNTASTTIDVATSTVATSTATFDKETVKIKVSNGSGEKGIAYKAYLRLTVNGYENVDTGNADKFDYEGVIIRANTVISSNSGDMEIINDIKNTLDSYYRNITVEYIDNPDYDIEVIIGSQE